MKLISLVRSALGRSTNCAQQKVVSFRILQRFFGSVNSSIHTYGVKEWRNEKKETGIAGTPVVPNARDVLISIYNQTIDKARSYEDVGYNRLIISLCEHRMNIVKTAQTIADLEKQIDCGQVEEIIEQAEDELELLVEINENMDPKPWEHDPLVQSSWDNYTYPEGITKESLQEEMDETPEELMAEMKKRGIKMPAGLPDEFWTNPEFQDSGKSQEKE